MAELALGVVSLAVQLTKTLNEYAIAAKNARSDIEGIQSRLTLLKDKVEHLARFLSSDDAIGPFAHTSVLVSACGACQAELETLRQKLERSSFSAKSGRVQKAIDYSIWPFKRSEVQGIVNDLEAFYSTFEFSLAVDGCVLLAKSANEVSKALVQGQNTCLEMKQVLRIVQVLPGYSIKFDDIKRQLDALNQAYLDDQRGKIGEWLAAPDVSDNLYRALKLRQPNTGRWLLRNPDFTAWMEDTSSFLWLYGNAGCGKTILSATAVESVLVHRQRTPDSTLAYFYFDFNDKAKQSSENMIRSLVSQLFHQCPAIPQSLISRYKSRGCARASVFHLMDYLRDIMMQTSRVYIVLDALDECEDQDDLFDRLEKILGWAIDHVNIIATSRQEPQIEDAFDSWAQDISLVYKLPRIGLQSRVVDDDIRLYVHDRLQTDQKRRAWKDRLDVQQEIEETLLAQAGGMFRWAACQMDTLANCRTLHVLRKALKSLPRTLDETYERMLLKMDEECVLTRSCVIYLSSLSHQDSKLVKPERPLLMYSAIQWVEHYLAIDENDESLARLIIKFLVDSPNWSASFKSLFCCDNKCGNTDLPPLDWALLFVSENGLVTPTRLLLDLGADINAECLEGTPLHVAVGWRGMRVAQLLIDRGAEVNRRNRQHSTSLVLAIKARNIDMIRVLIDGGADVNAQGPLGTALRHSSHYSEEILQLLVDEGADIHAKCETSSSALHYALQESQVSDISIRILVNHGADVNSLEGFLDIKKSTVYPYQATPLEKVAGFGDRETVQLLLDKGANGICHGPRYHVALAVAAREPKQVEVVDLLLDRGADINGQEDYWGHVLPLAAAKENYRTVELLLDRGADVNGRGSFYATALEAAIEKGHCVVARLLLDRGADLNSLADRPLTIALGRGHLATCRLLLDYGVDVNAAGSACVNALEAAIQRDDYDLVKLLLDWGADISSLIEQPLVMAAKGGHIMVVELLLDRLHVTRRTYAKALEAALERGQYAIFIILWEYEQNINVPVCICGRGDGVVCRGRCDVVKFLLNRCAEATAAGYLYTSALAAAVSVERYEVARILLDCAPVLNIPKHFYSAALKGAAGRGQPEIVRLIVDRIMKTPV